MSGTLVGVVDCRILETATNGNKNTFVNLYKFMQRNVTVGNATLHASNYGSGGTGFDFSDEANPPGENAWAVFKFLASASSLRTTDFYVLIQWADAATIGSSPGNPASFNNSTSLDGVGIMMAYREDNGDPWNGTTNANGADTKGTPVWAGATLHVMTEQNETGARSTNKEDLLHLGDPSSNQSRIFMCGDADGMWFGNDYSLNQTLDEIHYIGTYTPRADLTIPNPYIMVSDVGGILDISGSIDRSNASGVIAVDESRGVTGVRLHARFTWASGPERFGGGPIKYVELPILISKMIGEDNVEYGLIGHLNTDIIRMADNVTQGSTNAAYTRAYLGQSTTYGLQKLSLAWGGGAAPFLSPDRAGVVF